MLKLYSFFKFHRKDTMTNKEKKVLGCKTLVQCLLISFVILSGYLSKNYTFASSSKLSVHLFILFSIITPMWIKRMWENSTNKKTTLIIALTYLAFILCEILLIRFDASYPAPLLIMFFDVIQISFHNFILNTSIEFINNNSAFVIIFSIVVGYLVTTYWCIYSTFIKERTKI